MIRLKTLGARPAALLLSGGLLLGATAPALANDGDYSQRQTLRNLSQPPTADQPITAAQETGAYPLIYISSGGFNPKAYNQWQTIELAPETGAVCGNGTPYKFFVNRVADNSNFIIYMEGGGAFWSDEGYQGEWAGNMGGIPDGYMTSWSYPGAWVSPFVDRNATFGSRVKTQGWNMVYVPYCTADNYSGDRVATYHDAQGQPVTWHHNGLRNMRAITAWMKNNLQRPNQMLTTGCSAGGVGSLSNHALLRRDLAPSRGFLISDSGPLNSAPVGGDWREHLSLPLHTAVRQAWGLDKASGPLSALKEYMPQFDVNDMGSIYAALSAKLPNDRMGATQFWQDTIFPGYAYWFYSNVKAAHESGDTATYEALLHYGWGVDTAQLRDTLDGLGNFGGYFPQYRDLGSSHCTSIVDFRRGDIQERNLELSHFIDSVLDGTGPVLDASETSDAADRARPKDWWYSAYAWIADWFS